jgi:hypothetical protein
VITPQLCGPAPSYTFCAREQVSYLLGAIVIDILSFVQQERCSCRKIFNCRWYWRTHLESCIVLVSVLEFGRINCEQRCTQFGKGIIFSCIVPVRNFSGSADSSVHLTWCHRWHYIFFETTMGSNFTTEGLVCSRDTGVLFAIRLFW